MLVFTSVAHPVYNFEVYKSFHDFESLVSTIKILESIIWWVTDLKFEPTKIVK